MESCSPLTANLCREGPGGHGMRGGGLLFLENKDRKQSPHPGLISAPPIQNTWTSSYLKLHLTLTSHVVCYSAQACHDKVPETECLQQKTLFFSVMKAESPRLRCWQIRFQPKASSPHTISFLCAWRREKTQRSHMHELSAVFPYKDTNLITRSPPL